MANNGFQPRSSRTHQLQDSRDEFPSDLLRDSVQLRDTSAPFPDIPSEDEDSVWPPNAPQDNHGHRNGDYDDEDEDEGQYNHNHSSNSATPGPSRYQPRGVGSDTQAARLRVVMDKLEQVPRSTPLRASPPPQPRSEADSDLLDEEDKEQYKEIMRDQFRKAAAALGLSSGGDNAATPKGSRIPVTKGKSPRHRRLSLESTPAAKESPRREILSDDEVELNKTQDQSRSPPPFRRSASKSFDLLRARLENPDFNPSVPSTEHEESPEHSPPQSPRVENLNESVVELNETEYTSAQTPARAPEHNFSSPPRPRPSSATGMARPRTSLLSNRSRPVSTSFERELGEINFPSGELQSSTPIKLKTERQNEVENRDWTRPTVASLHRSQSDPRSSSPVETWERQRERNWNSPRPKSVADRPPSRHDSAESLSPGHGSPARRESMDAGTPDRSRVSSAASMSSSSSFASPPPGVKGKGISRDVSRSRMTPSPSPTSPSSNMRSRTMSHPTPAEQLIEREKGWNRTPVRVRTTSMPGLDAAVLAAKGLSPASLGRSRSQNSPGSKDGGRASPSGIPLSAAARAQGVVAYQPAQPTSTLIRKSSLIGAVQEETEPESAASQSDARPSSPASVTPLPASASGSPGSSRSATPASFDEDSRALAGTPQLSRMERDSSRLQKAMTRSTSSPVPPSTTPQTTPLRPQSLAQPSSTPQWTPPRPNEQSAQQPALSTPSKRSFYEPKELSTPSPPKGGLPPLPSFSDDDEEGSKEEDDDESLRSLKEPVKGVVVPLRTFGRRSSLTKTPKFPGAWNTPGEKTLPPFDDREHPHPKGTALAALDLKKEDASNSYSDPEAQATPVARTMDLREEHQPRQRAMSTPPLSPQTPARPFRSGTPPLTSSAKTPAPPGRWSATPFQRKSILKVRFDSPTLSSQMKTTSRPTTPDAVVDDAGKILQALAGDSPTPKSSPPREADTPRRRARMNMVDSLGRDLFASDGTPIKRQDHDEAGPRQPLPPVNPALDDPSVKSETSAVEMHMTTPKRRAAMRIVNEYGDSIASGSENGSVSHSRSPSQSLRLKVPRPQAIVDLASPLDLNEPVSDVEDSDNEHSLHENIPRVRRELDMLMRNQGLDRLVEGLAGDRDDASVSSWTQEAHYDRLAPLMALANQINEEEDNRLELQKGLQPVTFADIPIIEVKSRPRLVEQRTASNGSVPQYVTKVVRYIPWGRIIITGLVIQTLLIFLISAVTKRKLEHYFITTYHDPTFAGFFTTGDPHAPTVSQWLMLNVENSVAPSVSEQVTSWFGDLAYDLFGSTRFLDTSFRPNLLPT